MNRKIIIYLILTFGISWGLALIYYLLEMPAMYKGVFLLTYMCVPAFCAIVVQKIIYRQPILKPFYLNIKPNIWFLVAWITPLTGILICILITFTFPWVVFTMQNNEIIKNITSLIPAYKLDIVREQMNNLPLPVFWYTLLAGMFAGITLNALAALGEEIGWRGLMLSELSPKGNFLASIIIGVVWGIWHAPIVLMGHNYPEHPVIGVFCMILFCTLSSPLFTFITLRSGSVLASAILHGTINGVAALAVVTFSGGNDLTLGLTGLPGIGVLLALIAVMLDYERLGTHEDERIYK
ncbi:MAG: CPBP family intramembrane glutamic endopeptidase [Cytophagales bacterium]|nr:CPBP family intramembrane glutamic endopeptidase [Cytophagales bacterium]